MNPCSILREVIRRADGVKITPLHFSSHRRLGRPPLLPSHTNRNFLQESSTGRFAGTGTFDFLGGGLYRISGKLSSALVSTAAATQKPAYKTSFSFWPADSRAAGSRPFMKAISFTVWLPRTTSLARDSSVSPSLTVYILILRMLSRGP